MSGIQNKGGPKDPAAASSGGLNVMWDLDRLVGETEVYAPPMDVFEQEDLLVVEIELPGAAKEDIEVYVSRNAVTVEGLKKGETKREREQPSKQVSFLRLERKFGRFFRQIELPTPCNARACEACYENGLLVLTFKKIQDRRGERHRIEVK